MIPKLIHLLITSAKLTSIKLANSLTLINSVNCNLLSTASSPMASAISCFFSRRSLAFTLFPLPAPPVSLACVSWIFRWISFSSINFSSRRAPPLCWGGRCCCPPRPRLNPPPPPRLSWSLLTNTWRWTLSFLVSGIRLRGLFSSRTGLVSLLTGKSILPKIFGPESFSTSIFSITGGASSVGLAGSSFTGGATSAFTSVFFFFSAGFTSCSTFSSFFAFVPFLGRTEESIASRSILVTTFGPSTTGASAFTISSAFSTFSSFSSLAGAGSSFLREGLADLKEISSSSFFLRTSPGAFLGSSNWSLFILAALSLWNSCCKERYISSVNLDVGFKSSLGKPLPTKKSISVSCPMLNSLAAASNLGSFNSAIQLF